MLPLPAQSRDAAPLRLIPWMSCEPPAHIEALLHQLMLLFAEVQWILSKSLQLLADRFPHRTSLWCLGMTYRMPSSMVSWLAGPLLLTRSNRAPQWLLTPTPLAETFLDMILPQMVPVKPVQTLCTEIQLQLSYGRNKSEQLRSAICIGPGPLWLAFSSIGTSNQCYCWPYGS